MSAVFDSVCCILVLFTILSYAIDEGVIDCGSSISKYVQFNISQKKQMYISTSRPPL